MRSKLERAGIIFVEWLFPLTGLGATESGIDSRVFKVIAIISTRQDPDSMSHRSSW